MAMSNSGPPIRLPNANTGIDPTQDRVMTTNTIKLHRVLKAPPDRVYKAFIDPAAMCKVFPPNGFTCTVHHMDPKVGGTYKASFTNFSSGKSHSFGGTYKELKPGAKLVYSDKFDDPNLPGEM